MVHSAEKAIYEEAEDGTPAVITLLPAASGLSLRAPPGVESVLDGMEPMNSPSVVKKVTPRVKKIAKKLDAPSVHRMDDPLHLLHDLEDSDLDSEEEMPLPPVAPLTTGEQRRNNKIAALLTSAARHHAAQQQREAPEWTGDEARHAAGGKSNKRKRFDEAATPATLLAEIQATGQEFSAAVAKKVRAVF